MKVCQAVNDYMARIGAEQCNFRRWQIREYRGQYYFEKAYISIDKKGKVKAPEGFEPTEEEASAIERDWNEKDLPHIIPARDTRGIRLHTTGSVLYEFFNDEGQLIFCQERCEPKQYLPWTFWSDGEWRCMHPEDVYPFWRPKKRKKKNKIMVHEGCKAAKFCDELPEDHPWYKVLSEYEHWGIIGGALAVNRADYKSLRAEKSQEVVYVCDNDWPGRSVLQEVSRNYGGHLIGVMWDRRFTDSFDLADPLPAEFFNSKSQYIGPTFEYFRRPATFATEKQLEEKKEGEKGKPKEYLVIRKVFMEEWVHCVTPEVFLHKDWPATMYTANEFNNFIAPYSHSKDTASLLMKDGAGKGFRLKYDPSREPGIVVTDEGMCINTHQKSHIKAKAGSVKPFIEFMEHLIPDASDRHEVYRWCATLIARPEIKMHYALLLISEMQGVGKGTLGEKILAPLIGLLNISTPNEEDIVNSNYNYWMAHKRLAVIHEIYAGHSSRAYNKLKSVITDRYIDVKRKYMADYQIENWLHVFACSNSNRAIKMSVDDRRWLVPRVSENKRSEAYWVEFHRWLNNEGGLARIRTWAEKFDDYVRHGAEAPSTSIKKAIIEESFSPGQALVNDVLGAIRTQTNGDRLVIADTALVSLIANVLYDGKHVDKLERPATVRAIAKGAGWHIGEARAKVSAWGTLISRPRLICSHKEDAEAAPAKLAEGGVKLFDIEAFYHKHRGL